MKKLSLVLACFLFSLFQVNAQVGIGTKAPQGALEIKSINGGLTLPRMNTVQRDALGTDGRVRGTIIYNLDGDCIERFDGTNWNKVSEVTWGNILNVPADVLDGDDVNDADSNPTNELTIGVAVDPATNTLFLLNADGSEVPIPTNDLIGIINTNGGIQTDWGFVQNIPADIADGDDVNDADANPMRIQMLPMS